MVVLIFPRLVLLLAGQSLQLPGIRTVGTLSFRACPFVTGDGLLLAISFFL